jgi:hypothetical protein
VQDDKMAERMRQYEVSFMVESVAASWHYLRVTDLQKEPVGADNQAALFHRTSDSEEV